MLLIRSSEGYCEISTEGCEDAGDVLASLRQACGVTVKRVCKEYGVAFEPMMQFFAESLVTDGYDEEYPMS